MVCTPLPGYSRNFLVSLSLSEKKKKRFPAEYQHVRKCSFFLSRSLSLSVFTLPLCLSFLLDPLSTIKRGVKKYHDTTEVAFFDIKEIKADTAFIKKDYLEFKEEVRSALSKVSSRGTYANEFFPANDNPTLNRFMVKDEGYEKRREVLYFLIYNCGCDVQKTFADSFLNTIFTKQYIETHVWPLGR